MNPRLFLPLTLCAGLSLTGCDKSSPAASTAAPANSNAAAAEPPALPELPAGPSETELNLEKQVRELEMRELDLRQQVEEQKLAATEKEIEKERALLEKEREAFLLEQQLAEAKSAARPMAGETDADPPSRQPSRSTVPAYAPGKSYDYQMFYDELDPLGSWFNSSDYGYVWQPAVCRSDRSWRPYTRGRWVCTDQDWTWYSDEPFGWACYHYGRWAFVDGRGWIWVPGDQWAPAWVSWRSNDNYVGWCSLPPETVYDYDITYGSTIDRDCGIYPGGYVFMPVRHFDQPVLGHCEAPVICLNLFSTSINITNITIRRDRVQCRGPRREWIAGLTHREIPRYTLAYDHDRHEHGDRDRRPLMEKDRVRFYAPRVNAPWNGELRPVRAAETLAETRVLRGEGGLPAKLGSRFQEGKKERAEKSKNLTGTPAGKIIDRQRRLAELESTRVSLQDQLSRNPEILAGKSPGPAPDKSAPAANAGQTRDRKPLPAGTKDTPVAGASGNPKTPPPVNAQPAAAEAVATNAPAVESGKPAASGPRAPKENPRLAEARAELEKLRAEREARGTKSKETPTAGASGNQIAAKTAEEVAGNEAAHRTAPPRTDAGSRKEAPRQPQGVTGNGKQAASAPDTTGTEVPQTNPSVEAPAPHPQVSGSPAESAPGRRRAMEEQAAAANQAREEATAQRAAVRREREESNARELTKQNAARAELDNQRRQTEERTAAARQAKEEAAAQRAAMEQQRREREESNIRELTKQNAARAELDNQRRQMEERTAAARQAKEEAAAQRAAMEQQRRQQEEQNRAERQAREQAQQRAAMEERAREAAAERQRAAVEDQRRQAQEQAREQEKMRRQAEEQAARQEQARRQAEDQARREAERQAERQAEAQRRAAEQQARDAAERGKKR